ncbi:DUF308 domain-containing protein [Rhodococcus sp. IEGM 1379]|uniref:HdeD family acid-resistance protein n=1 Tax=Rhodococcus sp. IEGM 1379 TaxID=3047086 RepID=UPI0024B6A313|nr:DUF308 domain-containing protein [Rhodococcus sp. IEGM 1379]MDI9914812.1 DUF308 domain-containing protein [Rhodococcus sp. IEGM 1379]
MTTPIVLPTESEMAESARRLLTGVTVLLGVLTLGLGIAVLAWPNATLFVVAVVIAIQLFGFGIVQIIRSFADVTATGATRTLVAISGALAVLLGFLVLRSPLQTVVLIALVIGAWWVFRGVLDIVDAAKGGTVDRGLSIVLGVISIVAGAVVLLQPELSLEVFRIVVGIWMVLYGIIIVITPLALRKLSKP